MAFAPTASAEPPCRCDASQDDPVRLFDNGAACFREGEFAEALVCFEHAHAQDPDPTLLYNMARAHVGAGELEAAIEDFERYLDARPGADDAGAVKKRIAALREQVAERDRPPPPPAPTQKPAEPSSPAITPWIIAGVGLVGVGVGVGFVVLSGGQKNAAIAEPDAFAAADDRDAAGTSLTVGSTALIAGSVLVLAGATWGTVDLVTLNDDTTIAWGGDGLWLSGRF